MPINTLSQLEHHLAAGGSVTVDRQGHLKAQSSSQRILQKIADAFRSLSASGRAAIEARNAAVSRAMDEMIRNDRFINAARTSLADKGVGGELGKGAARTSSRTGSEQSSVDLKSLAEEAMVHQFPNIEKAERSRRAQIIAGHMKTFLQDKDPSYFKSDVLQTIANAMARESVRPDIGQVHYVNVSEMADKEVARLNPKLSQEERTRLTQLVSGRVMEFLQGADGLNWDLDVLREIVADVAGDISSSQASAKKEPSAEAPSAKAEEKTSAAKPEEKAVETPSARSEEKSSAAKAEEKAPEASAKAEEKSSGAASEGEALDEAQLRETYVWGEHGISSGIYEMAERYLLMNFPKVAEGERMALILQLLDDLMKEISTMQDTAGRVRRTTLRQAVADMAERLVAERRPDLRRKGTHPAPGGKVQIRTELTPAQISAQTILKQGTSTNTCFMISVLNSLMTTERGRAILRNSLTADGRLHLPGESNWDGTVSRRGSSTDPYRTFSRLEHSAGVIYQSHDALWSPGRLGMAGEFAGLFGMTVVPYRTEDGDEWLQGTVSSERDIETIAHHLNNDRMVLLHQGNHYMAVVGTEPGGLILRDSLHGEDRHVPLRALAATRTVIDIYAYPAV